jgi:hypothetical protein
MLSVLVDVRVVQFFLKTFSSLNSALLNYFFFWFGVLVGVVGNINPRVDWIYASASTSSFTLVVPLDQSGFFCCCERNEKKRRKSAKFPAKGENTSSLARRAFNVSAKNRIFLQN